MLKILIEAFKASKGRMPNALEMLQLKFKAAQQSGKGKVIEFPKDRITDWRTPRPGEGKMSELQSGIMKATDSKPTVVKQRGVHRGTGAGGQASAESSKRIKQGFSTQSKLNNWSTNQQWAKDFIARKNAEFNSLNRADQKEVLDMFETQIKKHKPKEPKAGGGIAGMLGERTGYESGRRAGQTAGQKRKASPTDWYTDKIIADNLGKIKSDMFLKYILPERSKRFLENITEDETYDTYDEDSGYSGIVRGDFITKDGKRIEFPAPADKDIDVEGLLEFLDKHDEGGVSKDFNVEDMSPFDKRFYWEDDFSKDNFGFVKGYELKGGGIAGMLGEPTFQDEDHRVPYRGGKKVLDLLGLIKSKFGKKSITTADKIKRPLKAIEAEDTKAMFDNFNNKIATQEALAKGSEKMAGPIKTKNKTPFDMEPESTDATTWLQQEKYFDPKALDMYGKKVPSNWIAKEKKAAQKMIDDLGPLDVSPNHPNYKHMKAIRQSAKDRLESIKITEALGGNIKMHDYLRMERKNLKMSDYIRKEGTPVVKDELSGIKKAFIEKKSSPWFKDPKTLTPEEELRKEFPGIDDNLIKNILADDNPQRIAEVKATLKEALKMQEKGMGTEEIINIFKKKPTKHASGGLAGMLGE